MPGQAKTRLKETHWPKYSYDLPIAYFCLSGGGCPSAAMLMCSENQATTWRTLNVYEKRTKERKNQPINLLSLLLLVQLSQL